MREQDFYFEGNGMISLSGQDKGAAANWVGGEVI